MALNTKFGVREICDVVFKAKAAMKIGNRVFYKDEPVIYFDTLKTSSLEGAASTVYAQGGKGNPRLVAWDGERTLTFTMEDALISPLGFSILSGAGVVEAGTDNIIKIHQTEQLQLDSKKNFSYTGDAADVWKVEGLDGPFVNKKEAEKAIRDYNLKAENAENQITAVPVLEKAAVATVTITLQKTPFADRIKNDVVEDIYVMILDDEGEVATEPYRVKSAEGNVITLVEDDQDIEKFVEGAVVLVDFYEAKNDGVQQMEITADQFGGNFYVEADTLFRDTNGTDYPAMFIIPNAKVQSNFTFAMAASGDPGTFTFTMDAFPDYTRFDKTKKVLAAIQMVNTSASEDAFRRDTNAIDGKDWESQKEYF